MLKKR